MKKLFPIMIMLISIILNATVFSRNDIIVTANSYLAITSWSPEKDTLKISDKYTWSSFYKKGTTYTVMPYTFGRYDNITRFISRIEDEKVPGGQGTSRLSYTIRDTRMAGLDCAGYVMRCWAFPDAERYGAWTDLRNISMEIEDSKTKKGDWINKVNDDGRTHQILCESQIDNTHFNMYQSTSHIYININNDYPGVKCNANERTDNYTSYSPFPQFSSPKPDIMEIVHVLEGEETEIALTIRASGDIENSEFSLSIDNKEINETDYELIQCISVTTDYNEYRLECRHVFEDEGFHTVKVKAGNDKSNVLVDRSSPVRTGCLWERI